MVADTFFFKSEFISQPPSPKSPLLSIQVLCVDLVGLQVEKTNKNLNAEKAQKFSVWCSISGYQRKVDITSGRGRSGNLAKSWICIFVALMHVPDLFTAAPQICPHTQWHQNVTLPSEEWFSNPEYWFLSLFLSWEKSFQGRGSAAANSSGPNPAKYFQ